MPAAAPELQGPEQQSCGCEPAPLAQQESCPCSALGCPISLVALCCPCSALGCHRIAPPAPCSSHPQASEMVRSSLSLLGCRLLGASRAAQGSTCRRAVGPQRVEGSWAGRQPGTSAWHISLGHSQGPPGVPRSVTPAW